MSASVRQEAPSAWTAASATTVVSPAFSSACQVGNLIEVYVLWNGTTPPSSVVDSASQSYTYSGTSAYDNNSGLTIALYVLPDSQSATALTVTATWASAVAYRGIWLKELAGVTASPLQTSTGQNQATGSPGTGTGAITSGNVTPTSQPSLLSSLTFDDGGNAASVVAGSLTLGTTGLLLSGNTAASGTSASEILTSTSATAATYTNTTDGATRSFLTFAAVYTQATVTGAALAATPSSTTAATGTLGLKHVVADLVFETTPTTGTSPFVLAGAVTGYRTFASVMSDQDTCLYLAQAVTGGVPNGPWEIGIGTYNASADTLSRTKVLRSSNANAAVAFPTGTTNVVLTEPAAVLWNRGVFNVGNSGSAITIDWSNGRYQMVTLTAACTITFANSMLCPEGVLEIYQDATGGRVPTITGAVYRSGSAPTWSTTNATHDTLRVRYNAVTGQSNVFAET